MRLQTRERHTAKTPYERKQGSADKRQLGSCDYLTGKYELPLSTTTIADILLAHALTTMIKHLPTLRPSFYTIDIYTQHNLLLSSQLGDVIDCIILILLCNRVSESVPLCIYLLANHYILCCFAYIQIRYQR